MVSNLFQNGGLILLGKLPQYLGDLSVAGQVQEIAFTGVDTINVVAGDGNDTINVSPHPDTVINVDGEDPSFGDAGVPPGDTLNFDPLGNLFAIVGKSIITAGGGTGGPIGRSTIGSSAIISTP